MFIPTESMANLNLKCQSGYSLPELLVGILVSSLVMIACTESFITFNAGSAIQTGIADAQTDSAIFDYMITADLSSAGAGLPFNNAAVSPLNCGTSVTLPSFENEGLSLVPVLIEHSTANDSITIGHGSDALSGLFFDINGGTAPQPSVSSTDFCQINDIALIVAPAASNAVAYCSTGRIQNKSAFPSSLEISATSSTGEVLSDVTQAKLSCMSSWSNTIYSLDTNKHKIDRVIKSLTTPSVLDNELVSNVMALRAQYGVSESGTSNEVSRWVDATGEWEKSSITVANLRRIKAVRFAVVLRTFSKSKSPVSFSCDISKPVSPSNVCIWNTDPSNRVFPSSVSADPEWNLYRYRVVENTVALDNILWNRD